MHLLRALALARVLLALKTFLKGRNCVHNLKNRCRGEKTTRQRPCTNWRLMRYHWARMAASTNRMSRNKDRDLLLFRLYPPPSDRERTDDKSTMNSSRRERTAARDQHIKFFEGNYSVTAAVSCERQTWGHYEAVNGKGRRGGSQGNLAILNILRHIIIVWFGEGKKKKMDRSGAGWVHACVTGQHHVCLIITPQSSLASPLSPSLLRPSLPLAR